MRTCVADKRALLAHAYQFALRTLCAAATRER